jgi:uncharacterized RDD family membrane protein YckC
MKTCTRCGLVSPESSGRCECGGDLVAGGGFLVVEGVVAGFWIRLAADLLDALVLGAIGWVIATVFRDGLLSLGERGVLLGIPLTLLYSGVLHSEIGGGQTLAKRLLRLRVLRLDGGYLSLDRSLVRWAIMGFVCYGGSVAYAMGSIAPVFHAQALSAVLGGAQLAIFLGCALLVPFHPLKRGLHDLLTGSIVIRNGKIPADLIARHHNPRRDRNLMIGAASVAFLAAAAGLFISHQLPAKLQAGMQVMAAMAEMGLQNPGVLDSTVTGPNGTRRRIIASGYLPANADGSPKVSDADDRVLSLLKKEMPLGGIDEIVVVLRQGINLGVYSSYKTTNHSEPVPVDGVSR